MSETLHSEFPLVYRGLGVLLTHKSDRVDVGEWQAMDISDKPLLVTHEVKHVTFTTPMPRWVEGMRRMIEPNLPWADVHFGERISGEPLNPPPSHEIWPFRQRGNEDHIQGGAFSHSYPERFWPKFGGFVDMVQDAQFEEHPMAHKGLRFMLGDLGDVVNLLKRNPMTRQAYLPVWFPEDTGAIENQRVPCTLGYHFLIRNGALDIDYHIRSCDFLRHFRDDVYMAMRLALWMKEQLTAGELVLGSLVMHIGSLHVFEGDMPRMRREFQ